MKAAVSVVLLAYACSQISCQTQHWERTPEQEKAAVEFQFDGVGFSTTPADFRRQFPDARIDFNTDTGTGTFCWEPKNADSGIANFFDGQLRSMMIYYYVEDATSVEAIQNKLIDKFGPWDENETEKVSWHFQDETHRVVSLSCDFDAGRYPLIIRVALFVMDTEVFQKEVDREEAEAAKVDVGL